MYHSRIRDAKRRKEEKGRELVDPDDGQQYGYVDTLLGNCRARVLLEDDKLVMARIRGSLRKYSKKAIVERGALVLVSLREFDEATVDIVHRYSRDEAAKLVRRGELPAAISRALTHSELHEHGDDGENFVVFQDDEVAVSAI